MAEKKATQPKRRVKNPETFREKALKASETNDRPKKGAAIRKVGGSVTKPVGKPIGRLFRKIGSFRIVKPFKKVFSIIGRILLPRYFRDSFKELKLVTWPNWKQSRQLTFAVLVFAIVFGVVIAVVDYGLDKLFRQLLLK